MILLKGVDCAAAVYTKLLRWGRWSGMIKKQSETPTEYGLRLINYFPGLKAEVELIINAFNQEAYGQTFTDQKTLSSLRSAFRQMQHVRYWPIRIKIWFSQ